MSLRDFFKGMARGYHQILRFKRLSPVAMLLCVFRRLSSSLFLQVLPSAYLVEFQSKILLETC
jgi:hypothetical protein